MDGRDRCSLIISGTVRRGLLAGHWLQVGRPLATGRLVFALTARAMRCRHSHPLRFEDEEEYQAKMMIISVEAMKLDVDWAPG